MSRVIDAGVSIERQEILIQRGDGNKRTVLVSAIPVRATASGMVAAIAVFQDITERNQREREMSRLAAIVESTDDAVTGLTLEGIVESWNRGAERLYGYAKDEIVGKPISILIPKEGLDEWDRALVNVRLGERVENLETVLLHKGDAPVEAALTLSPIRSPNGSESGIACIARDIGDRKRIEQALRASEERFRTIYRETPIGIELYDASGHLIDVNQACLDLFGVSDVSEVVGFDLFADPNVTEEAKERLRNGETVRFQTRFDVDKAKRFYRSSRSGPLFLDVLITPLGPKEGKQLSGYLVHVQDITERVLAQQALEAAHSELEERVALRTAELAQSNEQLRGEVAERKRLVKELRETNERLVATAVRLQEQAEMARRRADEREAIIASIADAVFICDKDGRVVDVNEAGVKLVGLKEGEVVGRMLTELLRLLQTRHPDGRQIATEDLALSQALKGQVASGYEEVARSPSTREDINLLVSAAPLYDERGAIVGAVEVMSNITRIKELDRLKDQFIAVAAHELKTPVAIMKGYAQALLRAAEDMPAPRRRMLDAINRGSDKIDRVVKDLLDISRLHVGRMELDLESTDLAALVREVVDRMSLTIPKHTLRIVRAEPVVVQGDKDRLEQVLANLIDNAVKYSPRGGDVDIFVTRDHEAIVAVRDYGVGIPTEKRPFIFERFYRAHTSTPYDYGGMGVGLYISKQIIERHGGRMWFESEEGKGSTFYFALPIG